MQVNQREYNVFKAICEQCHEDYSADVTQIAVVTGLEKVQVKGYIAALKKKNLVTTEQEKRDGIMFNDIWPTGKYQSFICDELDEDEWAEIWQSRVELKD